jgi:proteasome component ECM29
MILSTNHPIWIATDYKERYNAKSLLGHAHGFSDGEIRSAFKPHMKTLIPSLLRACNDPSKQTREQMNALWVGLTGGGSEAREIITRNLIPTLDTLIKDASSKLWRVRAGACGALSDIIIGRTWDDLGGGDVEEDEGDAVSVGAAIRLLRLWKSSVRALDDVRTPVRERGDSLGRAVRALTIRLCDPLATNTTPDEEVFMTNVQLEHSNRQREINAEKAATVSLGWLVKHGLNQPCAEATGICTSCLLGIVDIARPITLEPVLDLLVGALLMALSSLEPAALNYLQVRAAGQDQGSDESYDRLESARVRISQSGPIFEALQKCIDMIKDIDINAQRRIVPELDSALRRGAGFATRAAVADAVTSLSNKCPDAFIFSGQSTANPSVRLFRALYLASERERGAASKDRMTHALGSLAELVPGKAVRTLAAIVSYFLLKIS